MNPCSGACFLLFREVEMHRNWYDNIHLNFSIKRWARLTKNLRQQPKFHHAHYFLTYVDLKMVLEFEFSKMFVCQEFQRASSVCNTLQSSEVSGRSHKFFVKRAPVSTTR
jgi:hypothetical protein